MSKVPEDLKFTKSHEWFKEENGVVTMGISDYAQSQLTDIVYIELPSVGSKKKAGEVLLTIESVKSAEDVYSPVEGEVVEINKELVDKPELVNSDSYKYWMVKIKKTGNLTESLTPSEYKQFIGE
jgi:glycine cleavage system H protein